MMRNKEINKVNWVDVSAMYALRKSPTTIAIIPTLVSIVLVSLESPLLKIPLRMLTIPITNTASPGYITAIDDALAALRKRYPEKPTAIPPMINFIVLALLDF